MNIKKEAAGSTASFLLLQLMQVVFGTCLILCLNFNKK